MARGRRSRDDPGDYFPGFADIAEIGTGSLATVYRAREIDTNRLVALKLLNVRDASPRALESFERESVALGAVSTHPNIVTLYRNFQAADGRPVLVLELCRGSIGDTVRNGQGLRVQDVVALGIKIAGALETAHQAQILHRDVKPQNILVTGYGEPALADFGVAMLQSSTQTTAGLFDFTTLHAAPELLEGGETSAATDIYELASSLYQLVAGRSAFRAVEGESPAAVILRILRDPVQPLVHAQVPPQLSDLFVQAMSKDKSSRPATAAEFAAQLAAIEAAQGWTRTQFLIRDAQGNAVGLPTGFRLPDAPAAAVAAPPPVSWSMPGSAAPPAPPLPAARLPAPPLPAARQPAPPLPAPPSAVVPPVPPAAVAPPVAYAPPAPPPAVSPQVVPAQPVTDDWTPAVLSRPASVDAPGPATAPARAEPPPASQTVPDPMVDTDPGLRIRSDPPLPPPPPAVEGGDSDWSTPRVIVPEPLPEASPEPAPVHVPEPVPVPEPDPEPALIPEPTREPTPAPEPDPAQYAWVPPLPDLPPSPGPPTKHAVSFPIPPSASDQVADLVDRIPSGTTGTTEVPTWAFRAPSTAGLTPTPAAAGGFGPPQQPGTAQFVGDLTLDPASLRRRVTIRSGPRSLVVDDQRLQLRSWWRRTELRWPQIQGFELRLDAEDGSGQGGRIVALTADGPVDLPATTRAMSDLHYVHALLDAYRIRAQATPQN